MEPSKQPDHFLITDITLPQLKKLVYLFETSAGSAYIDVFEKYNTTKFSLVVSDNKLRGWESLHYFNSNSHYNDFQRIPASVILHTPVKLTRTLEER